MIRKRRLKRPESHRRAVILFHRYKVQRRFTITARDRSNKRFLFGDGWRTVVEADAKAVAETLCHRLKGDQPKKIFRAVEEWPEGAPHRLVVGPN